MYLVPFPFLVVECVDSAAGIWEAQQQSTRDLRGQFIWNVQYDLVAVAVHWYDLGEDVGGKLNDRPLCFISDDSPQWCHSILKYTSTSLQFVSLQSILNLLLFFVFSVYLTASTVLEEGSLSI